MSIALLSFDFSALKKMNEKKQVFNMYKTQKAKEEKVSDTSTDYHVTNHAHHVTDHAHRRSNVSRPRRTGRSFVV